MTTEPRVSFAPGADLDVRIAEAVALVQREGMVVIDDLVDPALLQRCRVEVETAYPELAVPDKDRNYGPYEGRHCMPMRIEETLAERAIFLPRPIEQVAKALLGDIFVFDSMGLLVAVPGAPDQRRHADATLFDEKLDRVLPPFALAFSLPLVTMDESSGRTAFWRRSHRTAVADDAPYDYAPTVAPGSAILWDFRVGHCGLANRSGDPRPVIFTVLARHWWIEYAPPEATRYEKFLLARTAYDALPPRLQRRAQRARLVDDQG